MSRGLWTRSMRAMRRPRWAAFLNRWTMSRVMITHPIETTIKRTHATVRAGSLKSSPICRADAAKVRLIVAEG